MDPNNQAIWQKFHIHGGDTLPFSPWVVLGRGALAELFAELKFKLGAEIGVRSGDYTKIMFDKNPGVEIVAVDPWSPYARTSQARQDRYYRYCVEKLKPYNVRILRKTSMEALNDIPDNSLDFVYIDGLHDFDNVMMDIIGWSNKVKRGGIVSGHDYYQFYGYGIIPAVDTYARVHNINMYYVTRPVPEDESPSWFWVKP